MLQGNRRYHVPQQRPSAAKYYFKKSFPVFLSFICVFICGFTGSLAARWLSLAVSNDYCSLWCTGFSLQRLLFAEHGL